MSLRLKGLLILWGIEGLTLLVVVLSSAGYLYRDGVGDIELRARETALLLRSLLTEPMLLSNPESVNEIASNAFYDLFAIDQIQVVTPVGDVLAYRQRGHNITSDNHIRVSSPVLLGSENFGTIDVTYSTENALMDAREHIWVLGSFALFGMACSGWLTWHALTKSMYVFEELTTGVVSLATGYPPEPVTSYDKDNELGRLVSSYNTLISILHPRPIWET